MKERVEKVKQDRSKAANESATLFFGQEVEPDNRPLFVFENTLNRPYVSEVLNVADAWSADTQEAQLKLQTIDYHLKKELDVRGWKPTTMAYRELLKEAFKELKLSKHMANMDVLNRLYYYFHLKKLAYG